MPLLTLVSETSFYKNYLKNNILKASNKNLRQGVWEKRDLTSENQPKTDVHSVTEVASSSRGLFLSFMKSFSRLAGRHETAHSHAQHLLFPDGSSYFLSFIFIISSLRFVCDGVTVSLLHTYQHRQLLHGNPAFMEV
jgi:hypothetical protein